MHYGRDLPGEWILGSTKLPNWKSVSQQLPELLRSLLLDDLNSFHHATPHDAVPRVAALGFDMAPRVSPNGSTVSTIRKPGASSYDVNSLIEAVHVEVGNNWHKLTNQAFSPSELFLFVDPARAAEHAALVSMPEYVAGYSPPGPLQLPPEMRCVWMCSTDSRDHFVAWHTHSVRGRQRPATRHPLPAAPHGAPASSLPQPQ